MVVSGGLRLGGRLGGKGCVRGNGEVGGKGGGSIGEMRQEDKVATKYY